MAKEEYYKNACKAVQYTLSCLSNDKMLYRVFPEPRHKMFQGALEHLFNEICEINTLELSLDDQTVLRHIIEGKESFIGQLIVKKKWQNDLLSLDKIHFDDVVAASSFRPYCNDEIIRIGDYFPVWNEYIQHRKNGTRCSHYKEFYEVLAPTLGYILYQEQVEEIFHKYFGCTREEAVKLKRAFNKKLYKRLSEFRPRYYNEGMQRGFSQELLEDLWVDLYHNCVWRLKREYLETECWLNYQYSYLLTYHREAVMSRLSKIQNHEEE